MKHLYTFLFFTFLAATTSVAQLNIDTLAFQDFETIPAAPVWNYTGTFDDLQSGNASPTSTIPNTPLGIGSSQAWHVANVSAGNEITFDNTAIPAGYDAIRVNFSLSAMNLGGSTGGPDNLDYVLVEYSLDNGATWVNRLRVRGATSNNSFWAYDATGVAQIPHLPTTEQVFQPTTSGLQVAEGYSFVEINFPGTITQLAVRITPRSSSASDSWLIDNLVLTGENACTNSSSSFTASACDAYTAPSGAVYTSSGVITDVIPNLTGCDSVMTIDVTINSETTSSFTASGCGTYTAPSGAVYTTSGIINDTIPNTIGCDSVMIIDVTINTVDPTATQIDATTIEANTAGATYQWLDCDNAYAPIAGATSQSYTASANGNYAVEVNNSGCVDTSSCFSINTVGYEEVNPSQIGIYPNPVEDQLMINGIENIDEFVRVEMVAISGQVLSIYTTKINQLDVSDLPEGVYFINVVTQERTLSKRFIKL